MRFLLDMGLAHSTAEYLRVRGHDAVHQRDLALQRESDISIVDKALSEQRIILTHDSGRGIRVRILPVRK